jgi:hypothetical protein
MSEGSKPQRAKRNNYRKNLYFTDEELSDLRSTDDKVFDACLTRLSMEHKRYILVGIIKVKSEYKATMTNEELLERRLEMR